MLYHCDALLSQPQRYASLKFRRYSRWFRPSKLDWGDACELIAFVEVIGLKYARRIFQWHGKAPVKAYAMLRRHIGDEARPWIEANLASLGVDDGLAVLRVLQEEGWKGWGMPLVSKRAIQSLLEDHTQAQVAKQLGLTNDQVVVASGRKGLARRNERARAATSLAVG